MNNDNGKRWATVGFWFGILASLACNIEHVLIRHDAPVGAVLASAFWPIALLLAIEVLARIQWPEGRKWWLLRYGGLSTVAIVAAIVSYSHMSGLFVYYGEGWGIAHIEPIGVDGLMVMCSTALLAISDSVKKTAYTSPAIGTMLDIQ